MSSKICTKCGYSKPLTAFYRAKHLLDGRRPDCIECHNYYRVKYRKDNIAYVYSRTMAYGVLDRIKNPTGKNSCYEGTPCTIGSSTKEVAQYILSNFENDILDLINAGEIPSIDRIEPHKGYSPGNVRIISWRENTLLGVQKSKEVCSTPVKAVLPNGEVREYSSIIEAHRELGIKRDTISRSLSSGEALKGSNRNRKTAGLRFMYSR